MRPMEQEKTVNVRIPLVLWNAVREYAKATRRSASAELAIVIEEALAVRKDAAGAAKPARKAKK
jgi:hypothetical protein